MRFAALSFALRELRGGLGPFRVFLACLALGVGGVAAVGSVVAAIQAGVAAQSRAILGGDVEMVAPVRFASDAERATLDALGDVSLVVDARSMARVDGDAAVVQLKAVDAAYPLVGEVALTEDGALGPALARDADGRFGAVAEPALATRLGLQIGDAIRVGAAELVLRATLDDEPDRAVQGFSFGPRLMISLDALSETGLTQPGTLFEARYRVRLAEGVGVAAAREAVDAIAEPQRYRVRDQRNGAPGVEEAVAQLGAFLTLVGLAALAVGGVGVGATVGAYLDGKRETIATLKTMGAGGATILWTYLLQIGALAGLGVALGVVLGAVVPLALAPWLAARLPTPAAFGVYPEPLFEAAVYGMLVAVLFALWPLARAQEIRAAGLFRDLVAPARRWPRASMLVAVAGLAVCVVAAAATFTGAPRLALGMLGGLAASLLALTGAAQLAAWAAQAAARSPATRGRLPLRLALSSVGAGGGAAARSAVLALGLGLTVLTAIGLVDIGLRRAVTEQIAERAPTYMVFDIQNDAVAAFRRAAEGLEGVDLVETTPMLRGGITAVDGVAAAEWRASGQVERGFEWLLEGDIGVSYGSDRPGVAPLLEGAWWPDDYAGEPLVSMAAEPARGLGVGVGDVLTVTILGRPIEARIANLRDLDFDEGGFDFLLVFNAAALAGAPHANVATIYGEEPTPGAYLRAIAGDFPATTAVRVADVVARAEQALSDIAAAARAGSAATLATGLVVLVGAAAAGRRRQIYDAAVLKTLGATRRAVLLAMTLRSALLGVAAATVALLAGAAGAWAAMRFVLEAPFVFDAATAAAILAGGVGATLATGALFAAGPLSARPARVLRARA